MRMGRITTNFIILFSKHFSRDVLLEQQLLLSLYTRIMRIYCNFYFYSQTPFTVLVGKTNLTPV